MAYLVMENGCWHLGGNTVQRFTDSSEEEMEWNGERKGEKSHTLFLRSSLVRILQLLLFSWKMRRRNNIQTVQRTAANRKERQGSNNFRSFVVFYSYIFLFLFYF